MHYITIVKTLTVADLTMIQGKLQIIGDLWYPLGMGLQLNPQTLRGIALAANNDPSACLGMLLVRWLMMRDPLPTVECLAESLSSPTVGREDLAQSLLEDKDQ